MRFVKDAKKFLDEKVEKEKVDYVVECEECGKLFLRKEIPESFEIILCQFCEKDPSY